MDTDDPLNEREFELINIIGAQLAVNQRDLSRQLDISLGMTNLLVRRLITKGYIRIRQLNKKKTQYILTPKGAAEKYHKSIRYTLKTIRSVGLILERLNVIIQGLYHQGERDFFIYGNSDLVELVEMSLRQPQWAGLQFSRVVQLVDNHQGIIFICREHTNSLTLPETGRCIDLVKELASQDYRALEAVGEK